ncbi:restriction endonuclease [Zunongwangia sp. HRR-M8]|uniref:restriction endonuclease n=1 Tax=Zunongwangia sp. HRR-M8 TaxID=3015170 RepID=UPI0022DE5715|nr:restriction endonuclease [Zunongwangia sp. HRR-M8]WBL23845.1 restriction endonuclease [Zunongwangia sp. HRR-M8]
MAFHEISQTQFETYNVQKSPFVFTIAEEVQWFIDQEYNLLGTVIRDKIDRDWSYVLMALDSDGEYRAIDVNVSYESIEIANSEIRSNARRIAENGKFKEKLYEDLENKIDLEITDINKEVKSYFNKHPEKLYILNPRKFEELIASILEDLGFDIELTKATRDGGSDIIARIKNAVTSFLILVECKRYSPNNKVSVDIVRQVAGVHTLKNPSKSIIVTTSTFTKDAIKEAGKLNEKLDLKDYYDLKDWLKKY